MKKVLLIFLIVLTVLNLVQAQINSGSFSSHQDYTSGAGFGVGRSANGDFDNDGKTDIVCMNIASNSLSIFRNTSVNGTISFASKIDIYVNGNGPETVCTADFDGDGKMDFAVADGGSGSTIIEVFKNTTVGSTISFATSLSFTVGSLPKGIVAKDFDGDGKIDIATANYGSSTISVLKNVSVVGTLAFATKIDYTSMYGQPILIISNDLDGDGKPDLAFSNYISTGYISYLKNSSTSGTISFTGLGYMAAGPLPNFIQSADLDGDSKPELFVVNYGSSNFYIYKNTSTSGTISFGSPVIFPTGSLSTYPQGIYAADFDGDGKKDIVTTNSGGGYISIFRNVTAYGVINSSSLSTAVSFSCSTANNFGIETTDLDNDCKPDIVITNSSAGTFSVFRNSIAATAPTVSASGIGFSQVSLTSMSVSFNKGNGTRRFVLCRATTPVSVSPISGVYYNANSVFGNGSQIGTGNYVVYSDTGSTFTVTGLTTNTTYYFSVYEYNGTCGFSGYLTSIYITGSQTTLAGNYYYNKSSGNLNVLTTWGTNTDGSGTSPTSFSTANSYYFAINNSSPTLTGNLTITGGNTAMIIGEGINTYNFTIPLGNTLTTDTFVLKKYSTVTVNGTLAGPINVFEDTTTAQYLGSTPQTIATGSYYNLIVGSSVKTLNSGNVVARNSLTLMSGINLNSNAMMIGTSTSQLGTLNYVTGTIYGGTLWRWFGTTTNTGSSGLFPIGTSTAYRPVQINYTTAPTTGGSLSAIFQSTSPNNTGLPVIDITTTPIITINKMGNSGTWILTPGALTGGQFTTTVTGTGFYGVSSYADLRMLRRNNSSSAWTNTNAGTAQVSTGTNSAPVVSRIGMNVYGEFGIGGDSMTNALPVKIIILTVRQKEGEAILNWETASENNSDHFTITRSTDNRNWEEIGNIAASGITNDVRKYTYTDRISDLMTRNEKEVYYRLEQVDRDGTRMNSEVVVLDIQNGLNRITLYPLPLNNILTATSTNGTEIKSITIYDLSGRELIMSPTGRIEVTELPTGMYIAKIVTNIDCYYLKVVK